MRRWLLSDYAHFLKRMDRTPEAVALLRKEIEQAPADTVSAEGAANMLAFDFPKHIDANDAVLWFWLADRPRWEHTETRLLWRILESVSPADPAPYFEHAEELARQAHPTRAYTVGWIMNRMQHPKRSIPMLEYAIQNAQDDELRQRAAFALFESYLDTGDWKQAERVFSEACKRLTPTEVPDWHCRIALTAARAGAKDDAMRIWKAAANVNPSDLASLHSLIAAGLRDELAAFYRDMATRLPASETPARALKILSEDAAQPSPSP
jgi:tetratricopeptide (TPR) repeat protein